MLTIKGEVRYPIKGDKFFIENGLPEDISWLHKTFQTFGGYADSYQSGAIILLDSAILNQDLRDINIYPAVFLIRHYLELRLKELIFGLNYCIQQTKTFPTHHSLDSLWKEFIKAYTTIGQKTNDESFSAIDDLIKEISSVDPVSMSFRYPVDKQGEQIHSLKYINLKNLRETFIRVCFVFDAISAQISHYVDITEEMMADAYRDYR